MFVLRAIVKDEVKVTLCQSEKELTNLLAAFSSDTVLYICQKDGEILPRDSFIAAASIPKRAAA